MKFNRTILIFTMVLISLLAISTVSASDNVTDAAEVADDSEIATVETEIDQDAVMASENDDEKSVVSVADDATLSDNSTEEVSEITIYSDGEKISDFNFTKSNGTYNFSEILQMLNQTDLNMSNFANFADMFANFNFTGENKTFDFKIAGYVNDVQYDLKLVSNPQNFVFDYIVKAAAMDDDFNNITSKNLTIYENGNFLTNVTFNTNALSMDEMMKMFNMTGFENMTLEDMMKMFNFEDMASQFGNSTLFNDVNKTLHFKIDGQVGNIKYDLILISNATDFIFDYNINCTQLEVTLDFSGLKFKTVNTAVDGKSGKYLTVTLKDQFNRTVSGKKVYLVLNNKAYTLTTDKDGKAKVQVNIAKSGKYLAAATFIGDNTYVGKFKTANVVVSKQAAKLTTSKKTYKAKAKTKKLTATFKSAKGKAIKNKKITFKVKGKTYTAKTNSKGVATVKVKLAKKGAYTFTAKFAGDSTYKAVTKSAKLILK